MAQKLTDQIRTTVNKAEQSFDWKDFVSDRVSDPDPYPEMDPH